MSTQIAVKVGSFPISWRKSKTVDDGEYLWEKEYGDIDTAAVWDDDLRRHRPFSAKESSDKTAADEARLEDDRNAKAARQAIIDTVEENLNRIKGMEVDELFAVTRILIRQIELLARKQ
jgi:hypothetical protein